MKNYKKASEGLEFFSTTTTGAAEAEAAQINSPRLAAKREAI
ncbi:hypothetical protein QPM17_03775 [Marinobacter sp. TBZ242]|uniref:Uncharacterized protein n=1 Tax=Marinobacter azerbaijanicus TaxID=3050455 RepID=A0ABT7I924_9GAMM|nr:hypothetical protein [Marinobacter sp. TBZ242]MDL0430228.1 hypothetical protein [Marinobacter sp. TBZ242]